MTGWVVLAIVLLLALGWYLSFSASRLDRLHHRVEGASAVLDAQLVRRAEAAVALAGSGLLDPASALLVAGTATDALAWEESRPAEPADRLALDGLVDRETVESDLSRALQVALGDPELVGALRARPDSAELVDRLASAGHRVQLARRFLNQAVTDAARVRRKRVVRWGHLAGRAAMPQTFDMDDEAPPGLG